MKKLHKNNLCFLDISTKRKAPLRKKFPSGAVVDGIIGEVLQIF